MAAPFPSTYRVQLHAGFDLDRARALVDYWLALGVGAAYASPVFAAVAGSMHGYDVTDPHQVNPELGGRAAFDRFAAAVRDAGLGLLLDIVPNHQAATTANPTWRAMLATGEGSAAANTFDVDWSGRDGVPPGVLMWPILGDDVDAEVAAGNLRLELDGDGAWQLRYFDEVLPVAGDVDDPNDVAGVLARQHYRLAQWRAGARARNYRRFFDVSTLAGVRVEDERVFDDTHALVLELVRSGAVTGLRVDHVDGLADPGGYLARLAAATGGVYTVIEKILADDETLPDGWRTDGTTGYEVCNEVMGVFIDPAGRALLEERYLADTGGPRFDAVEHAAKRQVLDELFQPEWERVVGLLDETADAADVDTDRDALAAALSETTLAMRVYRTYLGDEPASGTDRKRIEEACDDAVLRRLLLGDDLPAAAREPRVRFVRAWQQLTGPVMAKGHEDTACYRFPVLLAQSEVGGNPGDAVADAIEHLHRRVAERFARGERGLDASSTHDTKRSEDVRARLVVLSERPAEFEAALAQWRADLAAAGSGGDEVAAGEYRVVAHTLLGAWPLDSRELPAVRDRIGEYLTKALREAKQQTSWLDPDEAHEAAVIAVAQRSIDDDGRLFLGTFGGLLDVVSFHGACNALSQLVVKLALPGVCDVYQGTELWDFSLVDPDNRRPVDYEHRRTLLQGLDENGDGSERLCTSLRLGWRSGAIKLYMTARGLRARRDDPELFVDGDYLPLAVVGANAAHVLAFARRFGDRWAIAIVPRLTTQLCRPPLFPVGPDVWGDTAVVLPANAPDAWHDVMCSASRTAVDHTIPVGTVLDGLPVSLLTSR
jgi:(1->4)-alpha-D-glucan 1-alpha-D-glucosylmutase